MKRLLTFDYKENQYILQESDTVVFSINENDLKFDSLKFYEGIYKGENKSTNIELNNVVTDDSSKKSCYIFKWLSEIFNSICAEFGEDDEIYDTEGSTTNNSNLRVIPLFELAACAGDGFYMDENVPYKDYPIDNKEADYAVKISGNSMEPTISDGSIAIVKYVDELNNNDIGIFNVDGKSMCKRYSIVGQEAILMPDNESGEYSTIKVSLVSSCFVQGKVIDVIKY